MRAAGAAPGQSGGSSPQEGEEGKGSWLFQTHPAAPARAGWAIPAIGHCRWDARAQRPPKNPSSVADMG